jgi:hypothetical protein
LGCTPESGTRFSRRCHQVPRRFIKSTCII